MKLFIFDLQCAFGVLEQEGFRVVGFFSPAFRDREQAELFKAVLEDWREREPFWPKERTQHEIASAVQAFCAPILGIKVSDVMSADEILTAFMASEAATFLREARAA